LITMNSTNSMQIKSDNEAGSEQNDAASQNMTESDIEREIDDVMNDNEFMRRQIDLFAAFLWRHDQKEKGRENEGAPCPEEVDMAAYDALERELAVEVRLKMGETEKYAMKQEIEDMVAKSEKDVDTLRAVLEECRLRMNETKKDAYDFRRDIVISSQQNTSHNNSGEKLKRFIADKLKSKGGVLKKYKSKNQSLQQQISKLQEQLKISTSQSGDSFHVIDLEQLKIQNAQYNQVILERNKELLRLKMNTGKTVQQLNCFKQELATQTNKTKVLDHSIVDREGLCLKLDDELTAVHRELSKQSKLLNANKHKIQNADIPHVIDYVKQKQSQQKVESQLKSYRRKIEIAELHANRAAKILKMHKQQHPTSE